MSQHIFVFPNPPGHTLVQQGKELMALQQQELGELLDQVNNVFSAEPGQTNLVQHNIWIHPRVVVKQCPITFQRSTIKLLRRNCLRCCGMVSLTSPPAPGQAPLWWYISSTELRFCNAESMTQNCLQPDIRPLAVPHYTFGPPWGAHNIPVTQISSCTPTVILQWHTSMMSSFIHPPPSPTQSHLREAEKELAYC